GTADVANQMLALNQCADLPFLLFTSRYQKLLGAGVNRWAVNGVAVKAIEKRTGKMKYDQPELNNNNAQQFHAFKVDLRSGTVVLTSYNFQVTFNLEHAPATADAAPTPPARNARTLLGGGK